METVYNFVSEILAILWESKYILIGATTLIILERLFPYDNRQKFIREGFFNDLALYAMAQSYILSIIIFSFIIQFIDNSTGLSRLHIVSEWPVWVQVLFFLVTHDLYIYWFHRFQHSNKYFWRTHEAHHSTPQVDWLSGSRSHSLEILINQTIEFAPIVLLGAPQEVIVIKGTIDAVWGMYIHSNIDVHSGWLQYVINGPEMHRWHHAIDKEAYDTNFATKFAIWDWLFGTAFFPGKRKPSGYGLDDELYPVNSDYRSQKIIEQILQDAKNYFQQHIYAFRRFGASSKEKIDLNSKSDKSPVLTE